MVRSAVGSVLALATGLVGAAEGDPGRLGWLARERLLDGPWRERLAEHGIAVEPWAVGDLSWNADGGVDTGAEARALVGLDLAVDLATAVGWTGATLFAQGQLQRGDDASATLVGDLQAFDDLDAEDRTQLAELWLEQRLLDDRLRATVGKVDANGRFSVSEHAAGIHSSLGFPPTILAFPSYPDPAAAVVVEADPHPAFGVAAGAFDGSLLDGVATGERGPETAWDDAENTFLIAELRLRWDGVDDRAGRAAFGWWHHTGDVSRLAGGTEEGTGGPYLVVDQWLWHPPGAPERGVAGFLLAGLAEEGVSEIRSEVTAGLSWYGPWDRRASDVAGLAIHHARLEDDAGAAEPAETAVELSYAAALAGWMTVTADAQYIRHPGGGGLDDAVVFTLRMAVDL